jgi:transcriptional regulator of aromatic amino acid metabolism
VAQFDDMTAAAPASRIELVEVPMRQHHPHQRRDRTGKGLVRAIQKSRRRGSHSSINCSAIPETFGASFRHERRSPEPPPPSGKFELADSGTVFLDEITT